jgi:hypothetical protein
MYAFFLFSGIALHYQTTANASRRSLVFSAALMGSRKRLLENVRGDVVA